MDLSFITVNVYQEFDEIICSELRYSENNFIICFNRFSDDIKSQIYISSIVWNVRDERVWIPNEHMLLKEGCYDEDLMSIIDKDRTQSNCKFYIKINEDDKDADRINNILNELAVFCKHHEIYYGIQLI